MKVSSININILCRVKDEQGKATFVEVTARFSPSKDCFEFVALKNSTEDAPRYIKRPKAQATGVQIPGKKKRQVYIQPLLHKAPVD